MEANNCGRCGDKLPEGQYTHECWLTSSERVDPEYPLGFDKEFLQVGNAPEDEKFRKMFPTDSPIIHYYD